MPSGLSPCAALVREADRDRYLAALFASAERREALFALYAFNIEIARVRNLAREPMPGEIRLQWWRDALSGQRDGEARAHPVAAALLKSLHRHGIPGERLMNLIDAHDFDLYDDPMASLIDLEAYAEKTQGTLLAVAAEFLGGTRDTSAALIRHAGIAMTIATVLARFGHDASRRQLYVPLQVLDRHDVNREDVFAGIGGEPLRSALDEMRRHAREHLSAAQTNFTAKKNVLVPALLPLALVGPALRTMERRGHDPFQPPQLPPWRRQWLLWRAARNPARMFRGS
jgi:phytoene synthase